MSVRGKWGCAEHIFVLLTLLGYILAINGENPANYSGYKVIRVHPVTERQKSLFDVYFETDSNEGVNLWTEPMTSDHSMDFQVSSAAFDDFVAKLQSENIRYDILINDLQRLIDDERRGSDEMNRQHQEQKMKKRSRRSSGDDSVRADNDTTGDEVNDDDLAYILTYYANYSEIVTWLRMVEAANPNISRVIEIGTSYNGRPLLLLKIGEPKSVDKPGLWIDAGIHAREWISHATALFVIHTLVSGYGKDPEITALLEEFDWFILPAVNPDGYDYSHTTDRMWRKTRSRVAQRRNCVGVDANRNFDFRWQSECDNNPRCPGRSPCNIVFAGSRPFSEPETISVANFLLHHKNRIKLYLSFHSYSQFWLLPWAYTKQPPPDNDDLWRVSRKAVTALKALYNTSYLVGSPARILYPATGGSYDWAKGVAGIKYSFTMELRDNGTYGFILPPSQIRPTGLETWAAIKKTVAEVKLDTCWMNKENC